MAQEEIVRVLKVDTKSSDKSIKELRSDIKSLRLELEKCTVGTEEFDEALKNLTNAQKNYNQIQQQIKDMSMTNQQNMQKLASFAGNLTKSFSALNAVIGLVSSGNEDINKSMLKVQRTIQLIQGLSGIQGLVRDLPKVINGFKGWLNSLTPLERKIDNLVQGVKGIDPAKVKALANIKVGGAASGNQTNVAATTQQINTQTQAVQEQVKVVTALNSARDLEAKKLENLQNEYKKSLAEFTKLTNQADVGVHTFAKLQSELETATKEFNELVKASPSLEAAKANPRIQELASRIGTLNKQLEQTAPAIKDIQAKANTADADLNKIGKEINTTTKSVNDLDKALVKTTASAKGLSTFLKTLGKTLGWTLLISTILTLVYKVWDYITALRTAAQEQKKINTDIAQMANQSGAKAVVVLKELAAAYSKIGDSVKDKEQFIQQYNDKIKETGIEVNNVNQADDVFIGNTSKYVAAIMARAKAQATENKAIELYKEYLDKRYELEQKVNNPKTNLWQKIVLGTMQDVEEGTKIAARAEEEFLDKNAQAAQKAMDQLDADMNKRLTDMFTDIAELEKAYEGIFVKHTAVDKTDWDAEYKKALDALRKYTNERLDLLKEAKVRELDVTKRNYDELLEQIQENYNNAIKAAQGNAKKIKLVTEQKNAALKAAELAYEKEVNDIIRKYRDEQLDKEQAVFDERISNIKQAIEIIRKLNDTSYLKNPQELNYQTNYKQSTLTNMLALGSNWTNQYQSSENIKQQYQDQVEYNNKIFQLTKNRIEGETQLLKDQQTILEEKQKFLQDSINALSNDEADLDKRKALAEELKTVEVDLWTTKQTIIENDIALSDASIEVEQKNTDAFIKMQQKRQDALNATLSVTSNLFGAAAQFAKSESQNDKKSQKEREKALKVYKGLAITQAIVDTYKAANESYSAMASIPYVGPALGAAAAAVAIAMGLANVKAILSESISSGSSSSNSGASVSAPSPLQTAPIEYTRNLLGDSELEELNQPVRCYVLEQDITTTQNKVKVAESNASF